MAEACSLVCTRVHPQGSWTALRAGVTGDVFQGDVLLNVVPKKANWDLRRDVEKKLAKLERRTQRALVQLMQEQQREQLAKDGGQAD